MCVSVVCVCVSAALSQVVCLCVRSQVVCLCVCGHRLCGGLALGEPEPWQRDASDTHPLQQLNK